MPHTVWLTYDQQSALQVQFTNGNDVYTVEVVLTLFEIGSSSNPSAEPIAVEVEGPDDWEAEVLQQPSKRPLPISLSTSNTGQDDGIFRVVISPNGTTDLPTHLHADACILEREDACAAIVFDEEGGGVITIDISA